MLNSSLPFFESTLNIKEIQRRMHKVADTMISEISY